MTNFGVGAWVYLKTHHATDFAYILLAGSLPTIVLMPFIGAICDRLNRKVTLMVAEIGGGIASSGLAILAVTNHLQLWHIYVLAAVSSTFMAFTWPSMSAAIATLVSKDQLGRANGLMMYNESAAMIFAPMIGGAVIYAGGLPRLLQLDVLSFAIAITLIATTTIPRVVSDGEHHDNTFLQDAFFGFKYTWERKGLFGLMTYFFCMNFFGNMVWTLFTPLLLTLYNAKLTGQIEGFFGIGALLGGVAVSIAGTPKRKARGLLICGFIFSILQFTIMFPPSIALFVCIALGISVAGTVQYTCSQGIWMTKVPADLHGRVFSVRRMAAMLATPISFASAGPLADKYFGPAMMPGGHLAATFGPIIGTGPGAGIRLMFGMIGLCCAAISALNVLNPRIRRIEVELPDAEVKALVEEPEVQEAFPLPRECDASASA
ncbi:MAG: MFS transporter [Armatimonadetes bacterium]|nr:MFS transporter [Armatimonadota bacterium]